MKQIFNLTLKNETFCSLKNKLRECYAAETPGGVTIPSATYHKLFQRILNNVTAPIIIASIVPQNANHVPAFIASIFIISQPDTLTTLNNLMSTD